MKKLGFGVLLFVSTICLGDLKVTPRMPVAAATANQWVNSIAASGATTTTQPAFSNLSGNIGVSQMNSGTSASSSTFWRGDGTWASSASTAPTTQIFTSTGTTAGYLFSISTSTTCAVGDTYTNNGNTFTVVNALSAQTGRVFWATSSGAPAASGTLTRSSGSGTSSITFSSNFAVAAYMRPTNPTPLYLIVTVVGGGGGGGGGHNSSGDAGAGGGAGGTTAISVVTSPGATYYYRVGSKGTGGTAGASATGGGTGGSSTFSFGNMSAGGGAGGGASAGVNSPGAPGIPSVATGGNLLNAGGSPGLSGSFGISGTASGPSGAGGASGFGWGSGGVGNAANTVAAGSTGQGYGGGGSGGNQNSSGGDASDGVVIVQEFYQ